MKVYARPSSLIVHRLAMHGSISKSELSRIRPLKSCVVAHIMAWSFEKAGSSDEMPADSL